MTKQGLLSIGVGWVGLDAAFLPDEFSLWLVLEGLIFILNAKLDLQLEAAFHLALGRWTSGDFGPISKFSSSVSSCENSLTLG